MPSIPRLWRRTRRRTRLDREPVAPREPATPPDRTPRGQELVSKLCIWILIVLPGGTSAAYLGGLVHTHSHSNFGQLGLPWQIFPPMVILAELFVIQLELRRHSFGFSMADIPTVIGVIYLDPVPLAITYLICRMAVLVFQRRQSPTKLCLNASLFTTDVAVAVVIFRTVVPAATGFGPRLWLGAYAAVLTGTVVDIVIIAIANSLFSHRTLDLDLAQSALSLAATVCNTSIALVTLVLLREGPSAGLLMIPPAFVVGLGYRAYIASILRQRQLGFLFGTSRCLQQDRSLHLRLEEVLASTLTMLNVRTAELVITSPEQLPAVTMRIFVDQDSSQNTALSTVSAPELEVVERARSSGWILIRRSTKDRRDLAFLRELGQKDAALAVLNNDEGVAGWIVVGGRVGRRQRLKKVDATLLTTLAGQLSTSIQKDDLTHSVVRLDEAKQRLKQQASHDPLTGLANRTLFAERLDEALAKPGILVAVIYLDIDNFKLVNDRLGHGAGDALLAEVAACLGACVRPSDTAARLGGDEFAVLLDQVASHEAAAMVARRIVESWREIGGAPDREVRTSASVGVATGRSGQATAEGLILLADQAMYAAKRGGKDRYVVSSPALAGGRDGTNGAAGIPA